MGYQKDKQSDLLKNMPDGFAYFQVVTNENNNPIDFIFLQINPAFTKLTGFDEALVLGKKVAEIYPEIEKLDIDFPAIYRQLQETREPVQVESYFELFKSWFEITAYLDKLHYLAIFIKDITDRKNTEKSLRESAARYRLLAEHASDIIWTTDLDLNFTYISPSAEKISGYSIEEILSLSPDKILAPASFEKATETLLKNLAVEKAGQKDQNKTNILEVEQIRKDGSTVWVELNVSFIRDQDGNPTGILGITRDISARKQAEEKLRAEKQEKELIINNLTEQVAFLDPEMRIIWANSEVIEQHSLNSIDYEGQTCYKLYHQLNAPCPDCPVVEAIKTGEARHGIHKSPDDKYWQASAIPIKNEQEKLIGVINTALDITDLIVSKQALQESYSLLRMAGKTAKFGGWSLDLSTNKVSWSDQVAMVHEVPVGYTPSLGEVLSFYPPEWQDRITEAVKSCAEKGTPFEEELEIITAKGQRIWVKTTGEAVKDEQGNIVKIRGAFQDISEQKEIEAALLESEQRLDYAMTVKNEGIWDWNLATNETYFDDRYYTMAGYQPGDFPQDFTGWAEHVHPEDLPMARQAIEDYLKGKTGKLDIEFRFKKKDGQWMWINGRGKIFGRDEKGKPLRMVGTHTDITERKQAEEALKKQARERAAVDTFTYSVSQDLQAPLRRIEGFSEMLLDECPEELSEKARNYLARITAQIGSMKELTNALLQLSKIVSREIERETVDLSALIRSHLKLLEHNDPGRRVEAIIAPELKTEGDTELLQILLANLLDNAWKYTAGVKEAQIEFSSTEQNGSTVYYLKDNGAGFDMNYAEKLFIPFHKLHREGDYPGIGIGLNLVYRIISRHGGEIWAEGEVGKGACFYFTLP